MIDNDEIEIYIQRAQQTISDLGSIYTQLKLVEENILSVSKIWSIYVLVVCRVNKEDQPYSAKSVEFYQVVLVFILNSFHLKQ